MSESNGGNPIQVAVVVLLLVGGGWYFFRHFEIDGLDEVSVHPRGESYEDETYITYQDTPPLFDESGRGDSSVGPTSENPFLLTRTPVVRPAPGEPATAPSFRRLRIASWALDGFGPTKLANPLAQQNLARVIRQFDVIALQQIASIERDLIPRLVEMINQGGNQRYEYIIGNSTGPANRPEQLAFVFDTSRLRVDRRQTYSVDDPDNQLTFDPLVAWFRASEPPSADAWTFSLVNVRIDLAKAPDEVALLPNMVSAIRNDGRGEDDVILVGLLQADDAYLVPTLGGEGVQAAVQSRPTDIFGRYQTSNLLMSMATNTEYLGRGGVFDYLRAYNLKPAEAETVTSHLPVYADFTATEGGRLQ